MQFGEKKTQKWLLSWVFASMHAWLIVEPAEVRVRVRVRANPNPHPHPHPYPHPHPHPNQVVLMALLPFLVDNKWVVNCKEMAKELGIY